MIEVRELFKRHEHRVILGGISFDVAKGETAAVVGPSGGGKTTLLRCMHGLAEFDAGRVRIGDAEARRRDRRLSSAPRWRRCASAPASSSNNGTCSRT